MVDYYPVIARAISQLPRKDARARRELYLRARMVVAEHLQSRNLPDESSEVIRERAALEKAIRRVELGLRSEVHASPTAQPRVNAKSLSQILKALQSGPNRSGVDLAQAARQLMTGRKCGTARSKTNNMTGELGEIPFALGTMLFRVTYVMAAIGFVGVTLIRCVVWVAEGIIGYLTTVVIMTITIGFFISLPLVVSRVPALVLSRKGSKLSTFALVWRLIFSALRGASR